MIRNAVQAFKKQFAPDTLNYNGKRQIPEQQTLFPKVQRITWKIETTKLVELTTALSESNAFGENVSRNELWQFFSETFEVNLTNAEKILSRMKFRNDTPVRFLKELQENFTVLMYKN